MKKGLLLIVSILCAGALSAQSVKGFKEGNTFISGSASFNTLSFDGISATAFSIAPRAGYFVTKDIAVGAGVGFGSTEAGFDDIDEGATKATTFNAGLFARKYFGKKQFQPFVEFNVNYLSNKIEVASDDLTTNGFGINAGAGINYFVSKNFAFEAAYAVLGYSSLKADVDGAEAINNFGFNLNLSQVQLGLLYRF